MKTTIALLLLVALNAQAMNNSQNSNDYHKQFESTSKQNRSPLLMKDNELEDSIWAKLPLVFLKQFLANPANRNEILKKYVEDLETITLEMSRRSNQELHEALMMKFTRDFQEHQAIEDIEWITDEFKQNIRNRAIWGMIPALESKKLHATQNVSPAALHTKMDDNFWLSQFFN